MGFALIVLLYCLISLTTLLGVWAIAVYNGRARQQADPPGGATLRVQRRGAYFSTRLRMAA